MSAADNKNESNEPKPKGNQEFIPLEQGDYYLNEEGLMVFTAQYHLRRGYCCGNGCKHCPYNRDQESGVRKNPGSE